MYTPHTADHRGRCSLQVFFQSMLSWISLMPQLNKVNRTHMSVWQVLYGNAGKWNKIREAWIEGAEEGRGVLSTCGTSHSTRIPRARCRSRAQVGSDSSHYTTLQTQNPLSPPPPPLLEKLLLVLLWSCTDKVPIMACLDWLEPKGWEVVTRYSWTHVGFNQTTITHQSGTLLGNNSAGVALFGVTP